jgi:GT2 family glycosyltransferase
MNIPPVTVVIPHYSGDILSDCLDSLQACRDGTEFDVVVVDDSIESDGSVERARLKHPYVRVLRTAGGRGYGAACNMGLRSVGSPYAVLLNDDTEVTPAWISPLLHAMEEDATLAICQPKIHSLEERQYFDPGGGAGGLIDVFGYPFAWGSVVHAAEHDSGQYDAPRELAWAHGSALMLRMKVLPQIGDFDESFHMQAEEIDLCLRVRRAGFSVRSAPASTVFHHYGQTLHRNSFQRYYLSHRNTIIVMLKNWPIGQLLWALPIRLLFEAVSIVGLVLKGKLKHASAIMSALGWIAVHPFPIIALRRAVLPAQPVGDICVHLYPRSILWDYFVRGIKTSDRAMRNF